MCTLCQSRDPLIHALEPHTQSLDQGSITGNFTQYDTNMARLPVYSIDQIAAYLTEGYWEDKGSPPRAFDVQTGDTITVDLRELDSNGRSTAQRALDVWENASGLKFVQSSNAKITFSEDKAGANANTVYLNGDIQNAHVSIDSSWQRYGDFYLQTYIHEIGHALGLGHAGDYNGNANYGRDAHFANDSWQMTVMSYFDQRENTYTDASRLHAATAQLGDIAAIQDLYGKPTTIHLGDSTYGDGNNTGQFAMDLPSTHTVTIVDNGGIDVINLGARSSNQRLDLRSERFSDINGNIENLAIAQHTIIENATTGNGSDHITGNNAANQINSGKGNDTLLGNNGDDLLIGGRGADHLTGGGGADVFSYSALNEAGDTITDFSVSQGDTLDISAVIDAIGYEGNSAEAEGFIALRAANGGAYLMVDADGKGGDAGRELVFLEGFNAQSATASEITGTPNQPNEAPSADTLFQFDDSAIKNWQLAHGILQDSDGGTDTLDLTEVSFAASINLAQNVTSEIGGYLLSIRQNTLIENLLLGAGNDRAQGNDAANQINGGRGNDILFGGDNNDRLEGAGGNDVLTGGEGKDILYGGSGADTFVYEHLSDAGDTIHDFSIDQGDRIEVSALLDGKSVHRAINDGTLSLNSVRSDSRLELDLGGNGDPVRLALISNLDASTELTDDWLF